MTSGQSVGPDGNVAGPLVYNWKLDCPKNWWDLLKFSFQIQSSVHDLALFFGHKLACPSWERVQVPFKFPDETAS